MGGPPLRFLKRRGEYPPPEILAGGGGGVYPPDSWMGKEPVFKWNWIIPDCWFSVVNWCDPLMTKLSKQPYTPEAEGGGYPHPPPMHGGGSIPLRKFLREGKGGQGSPVDLARFPVGPMTLRCLTRKTPFGFCATHYRNQLDETELPSRDPMRRRGDPLRRGWGNLSSLYHSTLLALLWSLPQPLQSYGAQQKSR